MPLDTSHCPAQNEDDSTPASYQVPATSETIRLAARHPGQPSSDSVSLTRLANAGIRVRPDYTDPARWVATVIGHRTDTHASPDDAVSAAIRWLIMEVQQQRDAKEAAERRVWWHRFLG